MKKINLSQVDKTFRKLRNFNSVVLLSLGREVVNFSKERFVQKNWLGANVQPWKARNPKYLTRARDSKERSGKSKGKGERGILVDSGRLKRSIKLGKITADSITIGTDVPYAKVHNEGLHVRGTRNVKAHQRKQKARTENVRSHTRKMGGSSATSITVKAHQRKRLARTENVRNHTRKVDYKMEKRQFLPNSLAQSPVLEKRLKTLVEREMKKILK